MFLIINLAKNKFSFNIFNHMPSVKEWYLIIDRFYDCNIRDFITILAPTFPLI